MEVSWFKKHAKSRPGRTARHLDKIFSYLITASIVLLSMTNASITDFEREALREEAKEMFLHGFSQYMKNAFPADELMPLSCRGRFRDGFQERNRGDLDDALGNFSLTLVDSLDTLVIMNMLPEFEQSVQLVIDHVTFDSDVVVSVFEVNIRVLGGLISGHVLSNFVKERHAPHMSWYRGELLTMAKDLGNRLLPAFNTSTGIPHPRVNLKHGMDSAKIIDVKETCTACAGTMILEFGALSRLTGDHVYESAARKALDYLWKSRNRGSDLIGTILNIHNGDWIRRDAGVGAGVDSYYEYLLKAYILFGDDMYLKRFNRHYEGIMKYVSQGPLLVDVHMHRPTSTAKGFMDSLLAFWPGLQVLKGDLVPAIETHELLYQVIERHNYLMPEAFSVNDFGVHWAMSLMRPEFVESTYFLYKSTGDPHYLEVGQKVMKAINKFSRTKCGFAAVKDVRTGSQEDRMDSFVLAETFKYLYLLFAEDSDLIINLEDFIFTTEAHLLPLSLSVISIPVNNSSKTPVSAPVLLPSLESIEESVSTQDMPEKQLSTCPSNQFLMKSSYSEYQSFQEVRASLKGFVESSQRRSSNFFGTSFASSCPSHVQHVKLRKDKSKTAVSIHASEFSASNPEHLDAIRRMGIQAILLSDGKIQLIQNAATAATLEDAEEGIQFMQDMINLTKQQAFKGEQELRSIEFSSPKTGVKMNLPAGPALFGPEINERGYGASAATFIVNPISGCDFDALTSKEGVRDKIAITKRGDCMFVNKARNMEKLGAVGMLVLDNNPDSSASVTNMFSMSGDGTNDIKIPVLFLYGKEAATLMDVLKDFPDVIVHMKPGSANSASPSSTLKPTSKETDTKEMSFEEKAKEEIKRKLYYLMQAKTLLSKSELEEVKMQMDNDKQDYSMFGKLVNLFNVQIKKTSSEPEAVSKEDFDKLEDVLLSPISKMIRDHAASDEGDVYAKSRIFLQAIGFNDNPVAQRQSCLNPRSDPRLFLSFISRNEFRKKRSGGRG